MSGIDTRYSARHSGTMGPRHRQAVPELLCEIAAFSQFEAPIEHAFLLRSGDPVRPSVLTRLIEVGEVELYGRKGGTELLTLPHPELAKLYLEAEYPESAVGFAAKLIAQRLAEQPPAIPLIRGLQDPFEYDYTLRDFADAHPPLVAVYLSRMLEAHADGHVAAQFPHDALGGALRMSSAEVQAAAADALLDIWATATSGVFTKWYKGDHEWCERDYRLHGMSGYLLTEFMKQCPLYVRSEAAPKVLEVMARIPAERTHTDGLAYNGLGQALVLLPSPDELEHLTEALRKQMIKALMPVYEKALWPLDWVAFTGLVNLDALTPSQMASFITERARSLGRGREAQGETTEHSPPLCNDASDGPE